MIVLAASVVAIGCPRKEEAPKRIILIVVDTLRRDHVSPYGSAVVTSNVQRLADAGQVFSNAVASFHQTTMSMAALFTARTPSLETGNFEHPLSWNGSNWCGLTRFSTGSEDTCVPQGLTTLAESLQSAGYATVGVVSNRHLFRPSGYDQGFDEWIEVAAADPRQNWKILHRERSGFRVQQAVNEVLGRIADRPLFLYVHYMEAHDHGDGSETYPDAVSRADAHLGRLLDGLEERGFLEEAVVFFTSDHGEILDETYPGHRTQSHNGNPSFQPVLEIPLIVAPAFFEDTDTLVRSQDVAGLILRAARVEAEPDPEPALARDELFLGELGYLTYRRGRFKSSFHRKQVGKWALFDLAADPRERVNIIAREPEVGVQHRKRVGELVEILATSAGSDRGLSEEDRVRLRALGYLDD